MMSIDGVSMTSILVVEDHPAFAESLIRLLREQGHFEVERVSSGEQAVEQIKDHAYDLTLVDLSLPGRSGLWVLQMLHTTNPNLPCLVVSGHSSTMYVSQALASGARGYVLKEDVPGILDGIEAILTGETYISQALRPD